MEGKKQNKPKQQTDGQKRKYKLNNQWRSLLYT
jgi:hypothetical protein